MRPRAVGLVASLLVVATLGLRVVRLEALSRDARSVLVPVRAVGVAPSVLGDAIVLRHVVPASLAQEAAGLDVPTGLVVLKVDRRGVGTVRRLHAPGSALGREEVVVRFRVVGGQVRLGATRLRAPRGSWAASQQEVALGELKVGPEGRSILVGVRDAALRPVGVPVGAVP